MKIELFVKVHLHQQKGRENALIERLLFLSIPIQLTRYRILVR